MGKRSIAIAIVLAGVSACRSDRGEQAASGAPRAMAPTAPPAAAATPPTAAASPAAPNRDTSPVDAAPTATTGTAAPPLYYDRALTADDLEGRTLRELALMRNTIFARAGNKFRKQWLRTYFEAQSWYRARDPMDESVLTELDRANARSIAEREAAFTGDQLRAAQTALVARLGDGEPSPEDEVELRLISQRLGTWVGGAGAATSGRTPLDDPSLLEALISVESLSDLSRRDLRILRNTIYARRGYVFKSELLGQYFSAIDWYHADPDYTDARLTSVDRKNIRMIRSVEDTLGGPLFDRDHMQEDGWFAGA
jgi:hypothetical protein